MLKAGFGFGVGFALNPVLSWGQVAAASEGLQPGDLLVKDGDAALTPLTPADIKASTLPVIAWPFDATSKTVRSGLRTNLVLLIRLAPDTLSPATRPSSVDGVVAYSALCTHAGCDLSTDQGNLACDCHGARFDPKDAGTVIEGPTSRPQPVLPLKIVEGVLAVSGPFSAPIQFDQ